MHCSPLTGTHFFILYKNQFNCETPWPALNVFMIIFLVYYPSYLTFYWSVEELYLFLFCAIWWCHPCLYSAPAKTKCQEEAAAAPRKLGAHKPQCDEQGQYKSIQCRHAIGFCWCVDSTGAPIEGTTVRGRPDCPKGETWRPWPFCLRPSWLGGIIGIPFVYFSSLFWPYDDRPPEGDGRREGRRWVSTSD